MSKAPVKLSAKWQLDAALLSRPVDLTPLVTLSKSNPDSFLEDNTLPRLVTVLLNEKNEKKSDKDTKLDVLNILANVATGSNKAVGEVRTALQGVSEWFDQYMAQEESTPGQEPEMNKAMVLLLARCWDYKLKTEDVLELTQGNRKIALCTVVGLLEDGETYSTELRQKQKPGQGKMGQWEHELVCQKYEKPLMLQMCRLLRGFTHPGTYFEASTEELALFSVEKFAGEVDTLLEITLRSNLVEKLSLALYDCLFEDEESSSATTTTTITAKSSEQELYGSLEEYDHIAVAALHTFLQNLYFYGTRNVEEFQRHLLMETLLIPRLILPYLDRCVIHATILNTRAEAYRSLLGDDNESDSKGVDSKQQGNDDAAVAEMALHNPNLVKGMAASLRTLIIAAFRAPSTQFVITLLRRLNPTTQILRASAFCRYHDYIFALICMLNINMGALDLSRAAASSASRDGNDQGNGDDDDGDGEGQSGDYSYAITLLTDLAHVYHSMDREKQSRVVKRLQFSGALPLQRDTSSYATIMSILDGGFVNQFSSSSTAANAQANAKNNDNGSNDLTSMFSRTIAANPHQDQGEEEEYLSRSRAEAKRLHQERMTHLRAMDNREQEGVAKAIAAETAGAEPKGPSAFQIAVSVANASDAKPGSTAAAGANAGAKGVSSNDAKGSSSSGTSKFRLLGDLPSLGGPRGGGGGRDKALLDRGDVDVVLSLELHNNSNGAGGLLKGGNNGNSRAESKDDRDKDAATANIPKEFLCAINGHVMKEPVKARTTGLCFEAATIELWLNTRGAVCPITNTHLDRSDLEPAEDLRNRIKRYHIQQMTMHRTVSGVGGGNDDDLYDF